MPSSQLLHDSNGIAGAGPGERSDLPVSRGVVLLAMTAMLLVFYLFISVPLLIYAEKLKVARDPVRAIFAPVGWLHKQTPLKRPIEWYAALWGVRPQ